MADGMGPICVDLAAEHEALDAIVAGLDDDGWATPTPAAGWDVRDAISHLAFFDEAATLSATDPDGFVASIAEALTDPARYMQAPTERGRSIPGAEVLAWWRTARVAMLTAFAGLEPKARLPWYGPPMSAMSFATARLMETWAHGQDVADALGAERAPTARLKHVAHIGVRARPFSYTVRGRTVPEADVRVELDPPGGGGPWAWGDPSAADRVTGPALDFCLVVTQRRHVDDTALRVDGALATEWMAIAQAFAGGATTTPESRRGLRRRSRDVGPY